MILLTRLSATGQNGRGQNGTDKINGMDKMVYGQNGMDKMVRAT